MEYNMGPFKPNPKGEFNPNTNYKYFDLVSYKGGSYLNINDDTTDGDSVIGVLPTGQSTSSLYWMCLSKPGKDGTAAEQYLPFKTIGSDGVWDYSKTDKVIIPDGVDVITINNLYNGACGLIISSTDFQNLPDGSDKSFDYDYIKASANQYYMYSFVCMLREDGIHRLLWNRTVMNRE